jgi:hypothetical protein
MKKTILLLTFLLPVLCVIAQDTWKVKLNNKTLVATNETDNKQYVKKVTTKEWKKSGSLEVIYNREEEMRDGWIRTFYLIDEMGNEVIQKDSTDKLKIPLKELRKRFAGKKKIDIYTIVRPTDPEVAMRVRIRRVLLCTLELP